LQMGLHRLRIREKNARRGESRHELDEKRPHRRTHEGAWRGIGGGQGALSKAYKRTGVACRPSKQPDYSGSVRESNVVRLIPQFGNREVEMDLPETVKAEKNKARPELPQRALSDELSSMGMGAWRRRSAARGH